jgi:hypothetical protein
VPLQILAVGNVGSKCAKAAPRRHRAAVALPSGIALPQWKGAAADGCRMRTSAAAGLCAVCGAAVCGGPVPFAGACADAADGLVCAHCVLNGHSQGHSQSTHRGARRLSDRSEEASTFHSRDGGHTWRKIRQVSTPVSTL